MIYYEYKIILLLFSIEYQDCSKSTKFGTLLSHRILGGAGVHECKE